MVGGARGPAWTTNPVKVACMMTHEDLAKQTLVYVQAALRGGHLDARQMQAIARILRPVVERARVNELRPNW